MSGPGAQTTEIVIAGGGLAGIVAAYELLNRGRRVLMVDKDTRENFGGLAKESFGGVHMIGTPHQAKLRIHDSPELAWRDWQSVAHYDAADAWPRAWGQFYCENSREYIFEFLDRKKITFLPLVNWPERGIYAPGNTVPRWHIVWGTGYEIIQRLLAALESHPRRANLELLFDTEVSGHRNDGREGHRRALPQRWPTDAIYGARRARGHRIRRRVRRRSQFRAGQLVQARGGDPPAELLNGAHPFGDGLLHRQGCGIGRSGDASRLALALCRRSASSREAAPPRWIEPGAAAFGALAKCARRAHHEPGAHAGVRRYAPSGGQRVWPNRASIPGRS